MKYSRMLFPSKNDGLLVNTVLVAESSVKNKKNEDQDELCCN